MADSRGGITMSRKNLCENGMSKCKFYQDCDRQNLPKIVGRFHISNTDNFRFLENVQDAINSLQNDGQEVEVQYQTIGLEQGKVLYTALILGRK